MRTTIAISSKQLRELQKFSNLHPELHANINRAIEFRQKVLAAFNVLAEESETAITPCEEKPFTREEIAGLAHLLSPEQFAIEMEKATR